MRSKFQKQSALRLEDRIILHKHGYNTPQLAAELFPKLALGSIIPVICDLQKQAIVCSDDCLLNAVKTSPEEYP